MPPGGPLRARRAGRHPHRCRAPGGSSPRTAAPGPATARVPRPGTTSTGPRVPRAPRRDAPGPAERARTPGSLPARAVLRRLARRPLRHTARVVRARRVVEPVAVSYTHLRAHETDSYLVCRLLLEKKKKNNKIRRIIY